MVGVIFQIRDDIFDYYDSSDIGKPTGNDMAEGKLTLPVIYVLNNHRYESMFTLAKKVKNGTINADEIAVLVEYAKDQGGIEYAEKVMERLHGEALEFINGFTHDPEIADALRAYLDFVIRRVK